MKSTYIKNIYFTSIGAPWQSWLNFPVEMFSTCKTPLDSAQIMRLLFRGKNRQKITKTPRGKRPSAERKNVKISSNAVGGLHNNEHYVFKAFQE